MLGMSAWTIDSFSLSKMIYYNGWALIHLIRPHCLSDCIGMVVGFVMFFLVRFVRMFCSSTVSCKSRSAGNNLWIKGKASLMDQVHS